MILEFDLGKPLLYIMQTNIDWTDVIIIKMKPCEN